MQIIKTLFFLALALAVILICIPAATGHKLTLPFFISTFNTESGSNPTLNGNNTENVPLKSSSELSTLKKALERKIQGHSLDVRLSLFDYASGEYVETEGGEPFYPASMIKTLLLLAVLDQAGQGELSLKNTHALSENDKYAGSTPVTGSGVIQHAATGTIYTFQELISLMISESDNVATNILFDLIGEKQIHNMALRLDLENTAFTRKMYDLESSRPSNVSTTRDLTRMLLALENREIARDHLCLAGIQMMAETVDKTRIGRLIGDTVMVANKVGTVTGIIGDMALLYFPDRPPVALTIVVIEPPEQEEAARLIGQLAEFVVNSLA